MLFELDGPADSKMSRLKPIRTTFNPTEIELERLLVEPGADGETEVLSEMVFGEELLFLGSQIKTADNKRADILALDRSGNLVIVELKRHDAKVGVETQALKYLADFSSHRGEGFLEFAAEIGDDLENKIKSFLGPYDFKDLNSNTRMILVARGFDPTVLSIGEWLGEHGVPFRCVQYTPVHVEGRQFISFENYFERSERNLHLPFARSRVRSGLRYYWHNIGYPIQEWWDAGKSQSELSCGFKGERGDQGTVILEQKYTSGDTIIAYAKGYGAIGYGVIPSTAKYRLLEEGDDFGGLGHPHRLDIEWKRVTGPLEDGIPAGEVRERHDLYHPVSTSCEIAPEKAKAVIAEMDASATFQTV